MKYGRIDGVEPPISRLVQGTMMIGLENLDESFLLLDSVFEQSCTAFDTAHVYCGGDSERALGQWIATRGLRDKVVVIDKGAHPNADRTRVTWFDVTSDLYDSLARLKTDYIDLYFLHRDDPEVPVGEIVDMLDEHRRAGRIRAYGGSNWTHERLQQANEYATRHRKAPFVASSPHFSLAEQCQPQWEGCVSIAGRKGEAGRNWHTDHRMPVFAWSSLSRGFLSGRYTRPEIESCTDELDERHFAIYRSPENFERLERAFSIAERHGLTVPQVVIAYLFQQPLDLYAIVGCVSGAEFGLNAEALRHHLDGDELAFLDLNQHFGARPAHHSYPDLRT